MTNEELNKYKDAYLKSFAVHTALKRLKLKPAERAVLEELEYNLKEQPGSWTRRPVFKYGGMDKALDLSADKLPPYGEPLSGFLKKEYGTLIEICVPQEYRDDFYHIVDKYRQFQYGWGPGRRSLRTGDNRIHLRAAFNLLQTYAAYGLYDVPLDRYIRGEMSPEAQEHKRVYFWHWVSCVDEMISARVDAGNAEVVGALRDCFESENNHIMVSMPLVRGVAESSDAGLHQLLADLLVAARLQEGLRQVICENADCGTRECLQTMIRTIRDNDLIRFAAVKRAMGTWTGIFNEESADRVSAKLLDGMLTALEDDAAAARMLQSKDAMDVLTALWVLGVRDESLACDAAQSIIETGCREGVLAVSYYLHSFQNNRLTFRLARKAFERYPQDTEIAAAFMPAYSGAAMSAVTGECMVRQNYKLEPAENMPPITRWFTSRQDALECFEQMETLHGQMKKSKTEYRPLVFPWYGVVLEKGDFVKVMVWIAAVLKDKELIDRACGLISEITSNYPGRGVFVRLLLSDASGPAQRKALIGLAAGSESSAREAAFGILKDLKLTEEEVLMVEQDLRFKNAAIRSNMMTLLAQREGAAFEQTVRRLLASDNENTRLAGLDLIKKYIEDHPEEKEKYAAMLAGSSEDRASNEQILIEEITGKSVASEILNTEGYGIYDPSGDVVLPPATDGSRLLKEYFSVSKARLNQLFRELNDLLTAHRDDEYKGWNGDTRTLAGGMGPLGGVPVSSPIHERYPFPELWESFYQKNIRSDSELFCMKLALIPLPSERQFEDNAVIKKNMRALFGDCGDYELPELHASSPERTWFLRTAGTVVDILQSMHGDLLPTDVACAACNAAAKIPAEQRWLKEKADYHGYSYGRTGDNRIAFADLNKFRQVIYSMSRYMEKAEFEPYFYAKLRLDRAYEFQANVSKAASYYVRQQQNELGMYDYVKAYTLGIIGEDAVLKAAFETLTPVVSVEQLGSFAAGRRYGDLRRFMTADTEGDWAPDPEDPFCKNGLYFYKKVVDTILDVELKRGDSPTVFSSAVMNITRIYGAERLMAILAAMGKDVFSRGSYYYWYGNNYTKSDCLSHLVQVCQPVEGDDAQIFGQLAAGYKIPQKRIIELAMYAPQWLDIIEEYLQMPGLKSGCWYFMAHMNEHFDDKKKAMIAKYTPLTTEELNKGCFDSLWFHEAYGLLGDDNFEMLYKAAKYISSGAQHARGRKFADAALDRVTREELELAINEKRNQDLLMSYGILPVQGKADLLHRYEFFQKYLKESKQFGAQRRASEANAVSSGLKNLATAAGYSDDLRLTLAMETALVSENEAYFEGISIGEFLVRIEVDVQGRTELRISKAGKSLKTVPAAIKKDESFLQIKEFAKKLKDQYSRCVRMFETAMEDRDVYTLGEIAALCTNPVIRAILTNLVWVSVPQVGSGEPVFAALPGDPALPLEGIGTDAVHSEVGSEENSSGVDAAGSLADLKIRVAHPFDLYSLGCWHDWQQRMFEKAEKEGIKQPFKQVFRELYVKLEEEQDSLMSRLFAGNQIQPSKTAAVLKGRRWVADYEAGLQKVFYKDDIIAGIYALADWFSPADAEPPTLEYVTFGNRKSFENLRIKDVPDIVYSEVMRDVDLAVSVAYAGGVDPAASHSTIEMRKVIAGYNLQLFGLQNVRLEGTHAFIKGSLGDYTVHLGSGVIHQTGGHQINVLPVHSQTRGRIFLPFIDDDPKTAEIMTKILFFAEDSKIKDPFILEQIVPSEVR